jgi:hypothetical protein
MYEVNLIKINAKQYKTLYITQTPILLIDVIKLIFCRK